MTQKALGSVIPPICAGDVHALISNRVPQHAITSMQPNGHFFFCVMVYIKFWEHMFTDTFISERML